MNKSELKAIFINAKATDAKYIGVSIQTEGSSQPEIIINPNANFDAKFDYYMEAYDDDLILIAAKGKKDIRITAAGQGNRFEDIECQLLGERGKRINRDCKSKGKRCGMEYRLMEQTKPVELYAQDYVKDRQFTDCIRTGSDIRICERRITELRASCNRNTQGQRTVFRI